MNKINIIKDYEFVYKHINFTNENGEKSFLCNTLSTNYTEEQNEFVLNNNLIFNLAYDNTKNKIRLSNIVLSNNDYNKLDIRPTFPNINNDKIMAHNLSIVRLFLKKKHLHETIIQNNDSIIIEFQLSPRTTKYKVKIKAIINKEDIINDLTENILYSFNVTDRIVCKKIKINYTIYKCCNCNNYILDTETVDVTKEDYYGFNDDICVKSYIKENDDVISYLEKHIQLKNIKGKIRIRHYLTGISYNKKNNIFREYLKNLSGSVILKNMGKDYIRTTNIHEICYKANNIFSDRVFEYVIDKYKNTNLPELKFLCEDLLKIGYKKSKILEILNFFEKDNTSEKSFDTFSQVLIFHEILRIKNKLNIKNNYLAIFIYINKNSDRNIINKLKGKTEKEILSYLQLTNKLIFKILDSTLDEYGYKFAYNRLVLISLNKYFSINEKYLMLDCAKKLNIIKCSIANIIKDDIKLFPLTKSKKSDFIYNYLKVNSFKKFFTQLTKSNIYYLSDIIEMYQIIHKDNNNYTINFKDTFNNIHDTLSKDFNKLTTKNKKIPKNSILNSQIKNLKFNDIKYSLAKNTHELYDVGSIMNICVGSYADATVKKECYIIIGYKNDIPVTCIEIIESNNDYIVRQVKKKYNKVATAEEQKYLFNTLSDKGIIFNTYDIYQDVINSRKGVLV